MYIHIGILMLIKHSASPCALSASWLCTLCYISRKVLMAMFNVYHMWKFWQGKYWQIWWIISYLPRFSLPTLIDIAKLYLSYLLTFLYLPNFSLTITFICMVHQLSSTKLFLCTVLNLLTSIVPLTGPKTECTLIAKGSNWPCTHASV